MDDPNGWPDAERPGVPLSPEVDGWHWLRRGEQVWPFHWVGGDEPGGCADEGCDPDCADTDPETMVRYWKRYLGPCLLPSEVAARVAEAEARGRESGLREAERIARPLVSSWSIAGGEEVEAAILARIEEQQHG